MQFQAVKQTIQLRGTSTPRLTVQTAPRQTVRLVSSGPRGSQGDRGETGPSGAALIPPALDGGNF